jgi:hypothetical protein
VGELPQLCQSGGVKARRLNPLKEQVGVQQRTASLHMHPYPPMRLPDFLSEAHTSGETQTRLCMSPAWCLLMLLAARQGTSQQ